MIFDFLITFMVSEQSQNISLKAYLRTTAEYHKITSTWSLSINQTMFMISLNIAEKKRFYQILKLSFKFDAAYSI